MVPIVEVIKAIEGLESVGEVWFNAFLSTLSELIAEQEACA